MRLGVALFDSNGAFIVSWGYKNVTDGFAMATSVAIQPDGKIVTAGCAGTGAGNDACDLSQDYMGAKPSKFLLVRWNANLVNGGTNGLDLSFGTFGAAQFQVPAGGTGREMARSVAIDGTGIVVSGFSWDSTNSRFQDVWIRLKANGTVDPAFNGTGSRVFLHGTQESLAMASKLDTNTSTVMLVTVDATKSSSGIYNYGTLRLDATTGAFDSTFSGDGYDEQSASSDNNVGIRCTNPVLRTSTAPRSVTTYLGGGHARRLQISNGAGEAGLGMQGERIERQGVRGPAGDPGLDCVSMARGRRARTLSYAHRASHSPAVGRQGRNSKDNGVACGG